jgi:hypothetical protein
MTVGTVKWFNADKGYGFIAPSPAKTSSCTSARSSRLATARLTRGKPSSSTHPGPEGPRPPPCGCWSVSSELPEPVRGRLPGGLLCILNAQLGAASTSDDFLAISHTRCPPGRRQLQVPGWP